MEAFEHFGIQLQFYTLRTNMYLIDSRLRTINDFSISEVTEQLKLIIEKRKPVFEKSAFGLIGNM